MPPKNETTRPDFNVSKDTPAELKLWIAEVDGIWNGKLPELLGTLNPSKYHYSVVWNLLDFSPTAPDFEAAIKYLSAASLYGVPNLRSGFSRKALLNFYRDNPDMSRIHTCFEEATAKKKTKKSLKMHVPDQRRRKKKKQRIAQGMLNLPAARSRSRRSKRKLRQSGSVVTLRTKRVKMGCTV